MKKTTIASIIFVLIIISAFTFLLVTNKVDAPKNSQDTDISSKDVETKSELTDPNSAGKYIEYSENVFANTEGSRILFFHAPWCPQCRSIEKDIVNNNPAIPEGNTIFKVDYDSNQDLRQRYGVTLQTTFIKVDTDGNLIKKYVAYDQPTFDSVKRNLL